MRFYVLFALLLALVLALFGTSVQSGNAALAEQFSKTSTDTVEVGGPAGFLSVEAVGGNVGVRVLGYGFSAGDDSVVVQAGDVQNFDFYTAGKRFTQFAVYPASGATARGNYW